MSSLPLSAFETMVLPPVLAAGGSGAINLDLDWTFLAQIVVFSVLGLVLKPLLFDPVLKVFEEREHLTEGARAEAREMQERAGEILERYEEQLARVHRFVAEERERMRNETVNQEAAIIAEARRTVNQVLDEGRQKLANQVQTLRQELADHSRVVAVEVASKALGRELTPGVGRP